MVIIVCVSSLTAGSVHFISEIHSSNVRGISIVFIILLDCFCSTALTVTFFFSFQVSFFFLPVIYVFTIW